MDEDKFIGMEPAFREFYWLITTGKITEDVFVKDMLHRFNLLDAQSLSDQKQRMVEILDTKHWPPKESIHDQIKCDCNLCWGYNKAIADIKSQLENL